MKGRRKVTKLVSVLLLAMVLVLTVPSFSFPTHAEPAYRDFSGGGLSSVSVGGIYLADGQSVEYTLPFSLALGNVYQGNYVLLADFYLDPPSLPSGFSYSILEAYYTVGNEKHYFSYEHNGSSIELWTRTILQDLSVASWMGIYVRVRISCHWDGSSPFASVDGIRRYTATNPEIPAHDLTVRGKFSGTQGFNSLQLNYPTVRVPRMSGLLTPFTYDANRYNFSMDAYDLPSFHVTGSGSTTLNLTASDFSVSVPKVYLGTSLVSGSADSSVELWHDYLPSGTWKMRVAGEKAVSIERTPWVPGVADEDTHTLLTQSNSLLTQIRDKGGVNSDGGTHDRLDALTTQQQQAATKQQQAADKQQQQMTQQLTQLQAQQRQDQANADKQQQQMQEQYQEQQKQTDALTNFAGKSGMDSSKSSLDTSIGDYDSIESSIFDSASTSLSRIDIETVLKPSTGTLGAIQFLSTVVIQIVAAMGEFSSLYTVGYVIVLIIFLFGLSRFLVSSTDVSVGGSPSPSGKPRLPGPSGGRRRSK